MTANRVHTIKKMLHLLSGMLLFVVLSATRVRAQDTLSVCTVKDGKMYIWLSKKLPLAKLDSFIARFDLDHLALKQFIENGFRDSILKAGWSFGHDNSGGFAISKPLFSSDAVNNPVDRILMTGKFSGKDTRFPSVNNRVAFGYNRFRNKEPFAVKDSMVTFFLRNNRDAGRVMLAGSFNDWNPDALAMQKTDSGWTAGVKLAPGKHWYKFIIDGNWTTDRDNRLHENDGEGNTNSVFYYTNMVFRLEGYTAARRVFLTGSFNNWEERDLLMERKGNGWELPLYLPEGTHTYRFIADGEWITDPANPNRYPNEFDYYNSYVTIGPPHIFKLEGFTGAKQVLLSGSFNRWREDELYMEKTATGWEIPYVLGPGNYEYKFIVDGKSMADPANSCCSTDSTRSYLVLGPNYTFRLKGFENAKTVFLAGDFNNWSPNTLAMKQENGEWIFTVHLSPGKHLYKFVVDGQWIMDPGNELWEQNEFHTGNSVLWIE